MPKQTGNANRPENAANDHPDSMEQIRELLFGEYQRRVDAQLSEAQSNLEQLRRDENQAREGLDSRLSGLLEELKASTQTGMQQLENNLLQEIHALRTASEQRVEDLQTLLQAGQQDLEKQIHQQLDQLDADKVSRGRLASLMRQLADGLDAPKDS